MLIYGMWLFFMKMRTTPAIIKQVRQKKNEAQQWVGHIEWHYMEMNIEKCQAK